MRENCTHFAFLRIVNSWHREKQQHSCHTVWIQQPWEIPVPNSAHLMLWVSKGRDFEEWGHQTAWSESQQSAQRADDKHNLWVCVYNIMVCNSWSFPPFAATDLSQKQLTFASETKMVEVERRSKPMFSGPTYAHRRCWKQYHGSLWAKAQPLIISPQDNPLGVLALP